jgi:cobalt-zinc-cadmium efflux system protein
MEVASAHLTMSSTAGEQDVLAAAQRVLADDYRIEHATLQVEARESAQRCARLTW